MLHVNVHPADLGGCGHYRIIWPGRAAHEDERAVVKIHPPKSKEAELRCTLQDMPDGTTKVHAVQPPDCDVIVLQRPLQQILCDAIPHLQKAGIAVVVEVDDDFHSIHPQNPAWLGAHPSRSPIRNYNWLDLACRRADLVTVTTQALADRYGYDHYRIIPNYVPGSYLDIEPDDKLVAGIGWSGSTLTHPTDMKAIRGLLAVEVRLPGNELMVVGTGVGLGKRLGLPPREYEHVDEDGTSQMRITQDPLRVSGWVPIEEYPERMAEVGLGIVPLDDIAFNHAKSWLKGLEFAAVGVPFIATGTRPYRELHDRFGIGWVANKPKQWRQLFARYRDHDARLEEGERARGLVRAHGLIYEERFSEWVDAWEQAAVNRIRASSHVA